MFFWREETMKVVTAEQMQHLDQKAIETVGIPGIVLMENAGRGAAEIILRRFPDLARNGAAIIAGKGNNGGDGLVIARYLFNRGIPVRVFLLGDPKGLRGDAEVNHRIFLRMKGEVIPVLSYKDFQLFRKELRQVDLLIDGIFGTGLNSEVRGYYREVIDSLNAFPQPIVSIDIPSGLDANTGKPLGTAIRAAMTITFGHPKLGLLIPPGTEFAGELTVVDIGIPKKLSEEEKTGIHLLEEEAVRKELSVPRRRDSHKGDYGHLFVLAGSVGKTGAAAMACEAALRMGAGLVTLGIPRSLNPILEVKLTEAMTEPLPETPKQTLSLRAFNAIQRLSENKRALVIGPGIGTYKETQSLVHKIVKNLSLPMVLDADGLTALSSQLKILPSKKSPVILTPHPGEMARLTHLTIRQVLEDRISISRQFAEQYQVYLVLKGYRTLIVTPQGEITINPTGNPGMASGGTGDVLTGMIGGLISQGMGILPSLQIAVYLHGLAGDRIAAVRGERSLLATDLIGALSSVQQGGFDSPLKEC
jgi:NAD(P)H-hydrate epimerase